MVGRVRDTLGVIQHPLSGRKPHFLFLDMKLLQMEVAERPGVVVMQMRNDHVLDKVALMPSEASAMTGSRSTVRPRRFLHGQNRCTIRSSTSFRMAQM